MKLFLCGDVMTGRGIDQVLPHPSDPRIYERVLKSAVSYLDLAERANGRIERPVPFDYIWGDLLEDLRVGKPDLRIVNLETSITVKEDACPKGINYRMHPDNVACLTAAAIDCCVLANNHVLDWGRDGVEETCAVLTRAGIATAGAGQDAYAAAHPAVLTTRDGRRVLVFAAGTESSGIPHWWAARPESPGVNLLPDLTVVTAARLAEHISEYRRPGDLVIVSVHWGDNWGFAIPDSERAFAHGLIDSGMVDIVHGHSSHHAKAMEVQDGRLILYGCGDFINDYEGIGGYEHYKPDLAAGYLAGLEEGSGRLSTLEVLVFRRRRFRLERAEAEDVRWLQEVFNEQSDLAGASFMQTGRASLALGR